MTTKINFSAARLMICLCGDLSPNAEDRKNLIHPAVGGVILFARNFADGAQLRQLTAEIRRIAGRPLLIAVDQEGGRVQRFGGDDFCTLPPMADLAAKKSSALLYDAGLVMAAELIAAGVDLSFAPVLDIAHGHSQIIGTRAFADNGASVATAAMAFANGMRAAGMASCGKHFPGHGYAVADSHETLPIDDRDFNQIADNDLKPFAEWAAQKMPALMTAHIIYQQCDTEAATFSSYWLQTILREQLKFTGTIISDDLAMAGANIGDMAARMQTAIAAGCDVLLVCQPKEVAEALSVIVVDNETVLNNPWLALSPQADSRLCIGDADYCRARKIINSYNAP
ncbi:MAG: beta-N-acetylhexosaminidase [Gammaproteobacteria bacterium WSBS_2016_MAG_OTU1]